MQVPQFGNVYGVDFSGARRAGEFIWVAHLVPSSGRRRPPFRLVTLDRLDVLCGTAERAVALAHLVELISRSESALWGIDCPFGMPLELFPAGATWDEQFRFLAEWGDDAYGCGLECLRRALQVGTKMHIRRATDTEAKAPFDCYHYRMIYQTFFGMRDVVSPLRSRPRTAILPFQYRKLRTATRVLVECCPGSVLKRLGLPHQNYKQPGGGPLTGKRRRTRHVILDAISSTVTIPDGDRRRVMRNPGADALDAVLAAMGAALAVAADDHRTTARHPRYRREGRLYV